MSTERPPFWSVIALLGWAVVVYGAWALGYLH